MKVLKGACAFVLSGILLSLSFTAAKADSAYVDNTYFSYVYNARGEQVDAPMPYLPVKEITGADENGGTGFLNPTDLTFAEDEIYVLDAGNNRVVVLDLKFKPARVISHWKDNEGKDISIVSANGITIGADGSLYICNTKEQHILITDKSGAYLGEIVKPDSNLLDKEFIFSPLKCAVDKEGVVTVAAANCYKGLMVFDKSINFLGFFGANKVQVTLSVLNSQFWKKLLPASATKNLKTENPVEYSSVVSDKENFIYTTTALTQDSVFELKKLNPKGDNILMYQKDTRTKLSSSNYGDLRYAYKRGKTVDSSFIDIAVDDDGFISALDVTRGRVFIYDNNSNLLAVFGGLGYQTGTFISPVAVETVDHNILVLDTGTGRITVFEPMKIVKDIKSALLLDTAGDYGRAADFWDSVITANCNYDLAHIGIGKSLFQKKDYKGAMAAFRLADDRDGYDMAFTEYRDDILRANFGFVLIGALVLVVLLLFCFSRMNKPKAQSYAEIRVNPKQRLYKSNLMNKMMGNRVGYSPFAAITHPVEAFENIKQHKYGKLYQAALVLFSFFLIRILSLDFGGFIFNPVRIKDINIMNEFLVIVVVFALFIIANWSFCTLMDGEGKLPELVISLSYALMPLILTTALSIVATNVLTTKEGAFIGLIQAAGVIWSGILIFLAVKLTQQYTFTKTVFSILATGVMMLLITFLGVLVLGLTQQIILFVNNIYSEVVYRL